MVGICYAGVAGVQSKLGARDLKVALVRVAPEIQYWLARK
jgi:hypothetical protein